MKVSGKQFMKMLAKKQGIKHEVPVREVKTLKCGTVEFQIHVSPGQEINARKMCKRLLKDKYNSNNGEEKKFISKGYKGQNRW